MTDEELIALARAAAARAYAPYSRFHVGCAVESSDGQAVTGANMQVPAERLYDWLNEPVDLLKLDIEGAEVAVLSDCRDRLCNVRSMTIDLHEFNTTHRQTGSLFDLLGGAGFTFDMRDLVPLPWRGSQPDSPFSNAAPVWVATVRAWRN